MGAGSKLIKMAVLAGVVGYLAKKLWEKMRTKPDDTSKHPTPDPSVDEIQEVVQMTLDQLHECNGENGKPMLVSVKGDIYDVSSNPMGLYDNGSEYHGFLGHDCTYAFAHSSTRFERDLDRDASCLGPSQRRALEGYLFLYAQNGYPKVGRLVDPPWNSQPRSQVNHDPTVDTRVQRRVDVLANQQNVSAPVASPPGDLDSQWADEWQQVAITASMTQATGPDAGDEPVLVTTTDYN
eukprot:TRINITY_DN9116_c0_g1_i5.p1 TRINITY_DN9116_c0_g1~~TRINITY_DN9116_c0_g1_i5.p1  ORF type:complete len:237 (+),score=36.87 TRINITY_DN9116_c0_g1_i5:161-871(+)